MPLRQPPAERSFSLIPPNWNPVSNDRVLPHLEPFGFRRSTLEYFRFLQIGIADHGSNQESKYRGTGSAEH